MVPKDQYIWGTHDLVVHDYGPGRVLASIHVEVPDTVNIVEIHSVIDELERKLSEQLGIEIVIHTDPVCTNAEIVDRISAQLRQVAGEIDPDISIGRIRVIRGRSRTAIRFTIADQAKHGRYDSEGVARRIQETMAKENPHYACFIDEMNGD